MHHKHCDADPRLDAVRCDCDRYPRAGVAIDEFGYFVVRDHGDDFHRMVALARLGGQECRCVRAWELYSGQPELRPHEQLFPSTVSEWHDTKKLVVGLRLRRRLPKVDYKDLGWADDSVTYWATRVLRIRGWQSEAVWVSNGTLLMKIWCRLPRKFVLATFEFATTSFRFECKMVICQPSDSQPSDTPHQPYYVNARSYGQAIVSIEAILLMHGFDRRVE
jgi:hypothetical protein